MLSLSELRGLLDVIESDTVGPIYLASDIGVHDAGNLIVFQEEGNGYVQVGTVEFELDAYVRLARGEAPLRWPRGR